MDVQKAKNIFFLGIGGIGMSGIARYFHQKNVAVSGYDKTYSKITNDLEEEGIEIIYSDNTSELQDDIDLVIWTPAIKNQHPIYKYYENKGVPILKRSEVLGQLTHSYKTIAVAGTHGKTSVSTLIAHIFHNSKLGCSAFLGGISTNLGTNFIYNPNSEYCVVEADEFDRSFLSLNPFISVITSCDADHLDIYKDAADLRSTFSSFASKTDPAGVLFVKKGLPLYLPATPKNYNYSINESADFNSTNIQFEDNKATFNFNFSDQRIEDLISYFPGEHNIENATVAIAVAAWAGISTPQIRQALESFKGVKRRFEFIINKPDLVFIDDYAHHPEELRAVLLSVKSMYPGQTITGIFQPHLYSRTRDFAEEFGKNLSLLDDLLLLDIYPAREEPIEGIDSEMLLKKVVINNKTLVKKEDLITGKALKNKNLQIVITLGAGDISTLVEPLRVNILNQKG